VARSAFVEMAAGSQVPGNTKLDYDRVHWYFRIRFDWYLTLSDWDELVLNTVRLGSIGT
jgi:hypothetical protein